MRLTDIDDLRAALALADIKLDKQRDQHFLIDKTALEAIIATAKLKKTDVVLEIGPGVGTLTSQLGSRVARVIAVEFDERFIPILEKSDIANTEVIHQDFRHFDMSQVPKVYKVVANLPYGITSFVFQKLMNAPIKPQTITVLIQKEVAERITSTAGAMSLLGLSVQYYAKAHIAQIVPASSFYPAPKVDSAILHLTILSKPVFPADEKKLFRLWRMSFAARRKMLKNNLMAGLGLSMQQLEPIFTSIDIDLMVRAQELSLEDWRKLYQALEQYL